MKKRLLAILMAAVMMVPTSITALAAEGTDTLENQVLSLSFEENLEDGSGKGNDGTLSGTADYVDGVVGKGLKLTNRSYVNLGTSTDLQPENLTLSFWINPEDTMVGEQMITWNKNEWYTDGWYLSSLNDSVPLAISIGPAATGGQPYQIQVPDNRATFFPAGEWTHVAITYDSESKEVKVYRNAVECPTTIVYAIGGQATGVLGSDASMQKVIGYNGAVYNAGYLEAALDEYQIYNDVATEEEVIALYQAGGGAYDKKAIAQSDLDALSIPASVRSNMSLPTEGAAGSVITWESSNEAAITADGKVTRPAVGEDDVTVTLTATAVYAGGEAATKIYTVVVKAVSEDTTTVTLEPNSVMGNVTLVDDYLDNAYTKEVEYLLSMDSEKFLYEFYKVAGLTPTTTSGYGGWERTGQSNFRGHTFGHYMSALSMCYLSSDDEDIKADLMAEMTEAVEGLKKCQEAYAAKYPDHAGYISAFPQGVLRRVDGVASPTADDGTVLVPYYNLHKVLAGLIDIAKNADDPYVQQTALEVAEGFGEFLYNRMLKLTNKNAMLSIEYGGINEALYELYRITGNDHFKEAAQYFDETTFFQQLANGQDVLNGKHANTQIPKLTGAVKRYTVLTENDAYYDALTEEEKEGLDMYLEAGENFFDMVVNDHTYVTGGNSQSEHFHAAGAIGADATSSEYGAALTCETCNTYNMLKLAKALFEVTKDKKYMDYFENTYINAILSSQNPETGTTMYFQPMAPGYNKVFNRPHDEFWCCTGTGMENFSKLGDNIYMTDENSIYVHMFFSSEYTDAANNVVLTQEAYMPNEDTITIDVAAADGTEVKEGTVLKLRKPDWLAGEAEIKVNGEAIELNEQAGYYVVEVKDGDKITYKMPMTVVVYDMPDMPNLVAFKYGPIVLSCALSTNNIGASQANGILVRVGTFDSTVRTGILMEGDYDDIEDWKADIEQNLVRIEDSEDGQVQFKLNNTDADDELIYTPHYMRYKERYGLYMYLEGKDSELAQQRILAEKEALRETEVSIDSLYMFDDNNSEKAKNVQSSSDSGVGSHEGKTYRHADEGGWFSYDFAIDKEAEKNYLNITFYAGDKGRNYDILIDDEVVETYKYADAPSGNDFYVHTIEIPAELIAAAKDDKITVKFAGNGSSNFVGGVFGISITSDVDYDTNPNLKALSFDNGTLSEEFDGDVTEYVLTVPADAESVEMTATPSMPSGLIYINGILFDDTQPRTINLVDNDTYITLVAKAQDHVTSKAYNITILKEGAIARPQILAQFDFDDEETGFTDGYALATGTYTLVDHDGGKAIHLDGRSQFLEVTKVTGGSLLTGLSEMTISFQAKTEASGLNWGFYAAPNENAQTGGYETYLGSLENSSGVLVERYKNSGTRPNNANAVVGTSDWHYVTIVHTVDETIVYINGVEKARQSSDYAISDILGANSICYIGKANWGGGEYYTGLIDNYTIAGYAMTADEVKDLVAGKVMADKSALEAEIAACEGLKAADYTEETWAALEEALDAAEDVAADDEADQSAVNAATSALKKAKANLVGINDVVELPYVDVVKEDWFYDAVYYTFVEGLMTGMDAEHFGPYGQLSRAQFALILYRMEGEPEVKTEKSFHDIAGDEWYGKAVLWAAENGIVTGYQSGHFGPADMITREQMAVMMYRYAKYLGRDVEGDWDYSEFKDAGSVSEFATDAMKWATGTGVITGKENGTKIDPQGNTARAEAAVIIQRFMK